MSLYTVQKIIKLEPTLTEEDFNPISGTIEIVNGEVIRWEHPSVTQPSDSAINAITDATIIAERNLVNLRAVRNAKLAETDWEIVVHKEKGTNIPAALKTYRQSLRDITDTYTSLDDVVWPEKP